MRGGGYSKGGGEHQIELKEVSNDEKMGIGNRWMNRGRM
jgi:hypothetical protein